MRFTNEIFVSFIYNYCLNNPLKYVDPSDHVKLKTWDDFLSVVDDLWSQGGGSWDSRTDNIPSGGSQERGYYGVPSGSGFQGPGQPYILPEVTVTAKASEKKTPTTPVVDNDNPFRWDNPSVQGDGYLTFSEAKAHYQFGGGTPVSVYLNNLSLALVYNMHIIKWLFIPFVLLYS